MTTELATNRQLVAVSPTELIPAQQELISWCRQKIVALSHELREQRENYRQAKAMLWRPHGWSNAITRTKQRMIYYAKIKAAVQAGYLVVPNFDVEVIAVRVNKELPDAKIDEHIAIADVLPPRVGRYVDDDLLGHNENRQGTDYQGKPKVYTDFHPTGFSTDIDFPVALVKPAVLAATKRAMAKRIFDRIGVVRGGRRSDPIVVGQILQPGQSKWSRKRDPKCVSFFVAWWLDTRDL